MNLCPKEMFKESASILLLMYVECNVKLPSVRRSKVIKLVLIINKSMDNISLYETLLAKLQVLELTIV